jgi:hypothetical protein
MQATTGTLGNRLGSGGFPSTLKPGTTGTGRAVGGVNGALVLAEKRCDKTGVRLAPRLLVPDGVGTT